MSILLGGVFPAISDGGETGLFDFGISADGDTMPAPANNTGSRAFCFDRTGTSKTEYTGDIWWSDSATSTTVRKYSWTGSAWSNANVQFTFNSPGTNERNLAMTDVGTHVIIITGGTGSGAGYLVRYEKSSGNVSTATVDGHFNFQGVCYDPVNDYLWVGHFDDPRNRVTRVGDYLSTPTTTRFAPSSLSSDAKRGAAFNYVDRRWMFSTTASFELYSGTASPSTRISETSVNQLSSKELDFLRTPDGKSFLAIQSTSGLYFHEL